MRPDDHDPIAEEAAYAAVGRLLVTWASIDQVVTRALWRRDRSGPFPPPVPNTFPERWRDWSKETRSLWPSDSPLTWAMFELQQAEAIVVRNALAHWIIEVDGGGGRFSIVVHPHEPSGFRPAFERWWRRVQHMPVRDRHPGPASGRVTRWWDWQLRELMERWEALLTLTKLLADKGDMTSAPEAIAALGRHNHTVLT